MRINSICPIVVVLFATNLWAETYQAFFRPFNVGDIKLGVSISEFKASREKAVAMTLEDSSSDLVIFSEVGEISKTGTSAYYYYFTGGELSAIKYTQLLGAGDASNSANSRIRSIRSHIENNNLNYVREYPHVRTTGANSTIIRAELWESEKWGQIKLYFSPTNLDFTVLIYNATTINENLFFVPAERLPEYQELGALVKKRMNGRGIVVSNVHIHRALDNQSHELKDDSKVDHVAQDVVGQVSTEDIFENVTKDQKLIKKLPKTDSQSTNSRVIWLASAIFTMSVIVLLFLKVRRK